MIYQDGIKKVVFVNRITWASGANEDENDDIADKTSRLSNEDRFPSVEEKTGQKYTSERLIDHTKTINGIRYRVSWHGDEPAD